MDVLAQFMSYAQDFEKTLADDRWSRLDGYFADDAVYEVRGASWGCRLEGRESIFKGMKKSLDGFDRKFDGRDVEITEAPKVDGDGLSVGWKVIYKKEGVQPFVLRGRSEARYREGKISHLVDLYDAKMEADAMEWQKTNRMPLDPSYV